MVNLVFCGRKEFIRETRDKKIYCFGAGKLFGQFIDNNYEISVEAIIDNYRCSDGYQMKVREEMVPVISVDNFLELYDKESVVVITCLAVEEVLAQLDVIPKLDRMKCYVAHYIEHVAEESDVKFSNKPIKQVIPKKIHYCWFGGKPIPEEYKRYMESWKKFCPEYEIIRWDESNYDIHKNKYISQAYEQKKWAFVTDYARADILYHEGGVYFDTDVEIVASFDDLLIWDLFCGFENKEYVAWGLGIGSIKGHPILKSVMEVYENMPFVLEDGSLNLKTCPVIQSEILQQYGFIMNGEFQQRENVVLFPRDFFAPISSCRISENITKNTHSIHHYAASWYNGVQQMTKLNNINRIRKIKEHNIKEVYENDTNENNALKVKKYQIWECVEETATAGSKALMDIKEIAEKQGYQTINIHKYKGKKGDNDWQWTHNRLEKEWKQCYETIQENSILLLQHPFWQEQSERNQTLLYLKKEKKVKIISVVHDVERLRGCFHTSYMEEEFNFMLQIVDMLIVHNTQMKNFFVSLGVKEEKIIQLEMFDYLAENTENVNKIFEKSITIAGNLAEEKSYYIRKIRELGHLKVHLYGPNYVYREEEISSQVSYHGVFMSYEIPSQLSRGFGLIWDGDSLNGCTGDTGNYLRYNNPHKLSLYLAAGLPVIVWKEAAVAEFVESNEVGITVKSIVEIAEILENMDEIQYQQYVMNAKRVSEKLQTGEYTICALNKAEKYLIHV